MKKSTKFNCFPVPTFSSDLGKRLHVNAKKHFKLISSFESAFEYIK